MNTDKTRSRATKFDRRFRIICHLPVNNSNQEKVVHLVFRYLQDVKANPRFRGFTHSDINPAVFHGFWYSSRGWSSDEIVLCMIDYPAGEADVSKVISKLKAKIAQLYGKYAIREEEIWIVAHTIVRYD